MGLDIRKFYEVTDPNKTLFVQDPEDRKYYIDFASVRGGKIIEKLKKKISFLSPDQPTCALFTGHIGCGKSTELLRLKAELEQEGFHVVYFESSEDLEMTDVDIPDILLAIAKRISQSLENIVIAEPKRLWDLLKQTVDILELKVEGNVPAIGKVGIGVDTEKAKMSLSFGIGEITTKVKSDAKLREKLNQYLGPQKSHLITEINRELIVPAIAKLKQHGKKGLVVIVDNLDRIDSRQKAWGRPQQEYLFVDQAEFLTKLQCHLVYTMPLSLKFSNDYGLLSQRFPDDPKVLPMVPVKSRDGQEYQPGIVLLKQLVLARAFPELDEQERLGKILEIFENETTLNHLCYASGGHVRDLLRLLNTWIGEELSLPLSLATLHDIIRARRNEMTMPISDHEWELLRQVRERKKVSDDLGYQILIRSRLVFEYRDERGESWFDINPILAEARELN